MNEAFSEDLRRPGLSGNGGHAGMNIVRHAFAAVAFAAAFCTPAQGAPLPSPAEFTGGRSFSIADFGAKPDGSKCTGAFAAAFAAAEKAGGGRIVVPAGRWFSGAIRFRSNCELHLGDGAEVVFSQEPEDYLPAVFTTWDGVQCINYCPLVYAFACTNVAITGHGTLRGHEGE